MTREELNQIKVGKTIIRINSTGEEIRITGTYETRGGKFTYTFADGRNWQPSTLLKRCSIVTFGVEEKQELSNLAKRMLSVIEDQKIVDISTEQFEDDCNIYRDYINEYVEELVAAGLIIVEGNIARKVEENQAEVVETKKAFVEDVIDEVVMLLPEGCEVTYYNKRYDIDQYDEFVGTVENVKKYIKSRMKVLLVNKVLDELEQLGCIMNCVLDVDVFGEFEEGEHDADQVNHFQTFDTMVIRGHNYYFKDYSEVKAFLKLVGFKYEIPKLTPVELETDVYCVEIRYDVIRYCSVERISNGLVYDMYIFYDYLNPHHFKKIS